MLPTIISLLLSVRSLNTANLSSANVPTILATESMSMDDRYGNTFVNDVFKDNILLTMSYMDGQVKSKADIDWKKVEAPFTYEFTLKPGEEFAFHDQVLPKYSKNIVQTTNSHYNYDEGFKSDGFLTGDGVCHLASLIYWAAKDANLDAYAPTNHNFAHINDVPKEYGVAIYVDKSAHEGENSNLYITNNREKPVTFKFVYKNDVLSVSITD